MNRLLLIFFTCCFVCSLSLNAQPSKFDKNHFESVNVSMSFNKFLGKEVIRVIKDTTMKQVDAPTFVKLKGVEFNNGTIEVKVLSKLLPDAPASARGFIGLAFRLKEDNSRFECIYIRPTNGRAGDQLRRNHSIQYFSYPDYAFDRLRKEAPGEYESYSDMGLNEWIKLKIVVLDDHAKLYINDSKQPSLIVNDLKHGAYSSGTIGLWVDIGTEGFFSEVKITEKLKNTAVEKNLDPPTILFVCEHGAGRSAIGASYFNKIAKVKGLNYKAIFRGVEPQDSLAASTKIGLIQDSIDVTNLIPIRLEKKDIDHAYKVITLDCNLPDSLNKVDLKWTGIEMNGNYDFSKKQIASRVDSLIGILKKTKK